MEDAPGRLDKLIIMQLTTTNNFQRIRGILILVHMCMFNTVIQV